MSQNRSREEMLRRDAVSPSPEQRAKWLWDRLEGKTLSTIRPTQWDLICFSVECIATLSAEIPFLQEIAKHLVRIVYTAHYQTIEVYPSSCPYQSSKPQSSTTAALPEIPLSLKDSDDQH